MVRIGLHLRLLGPAFLNVLGDFKSVPVPRTWREAPGTPTGRLQLNELFQKMGFDE